MTRTLRLTIPLLLLLSLLLFAQTQLLLLDEATLDKETLEGLRRIEALARRMREMLRPAAPVG